VIVWGRDPAKAYDLVRRLADSPVAIEVAPELPNVLGLADIICSATLAREPLIEGHRVAPGTHVDLVGSFTPDMREADTELFRRGRLVVDTETAFDESGDLTEPLREGVIDRNAPDLTGLLNSPALRRDSEREITIFKTVGTALADLAAARFILSRCARTPDFSLPCGRSS
jgi:alanine dehydrogenase